jgi:Abnormal spindle-like microcephaly-assoc'd, ASPM-SPD-2-Hydin
MSRGVFMRCVAVLLAGLVVAACASQSGGGGAGGAAGGGAGGGGGDVATQGSGARGHVTTPAQRGDGSKGTAGASDGHQMSSDGAGGSNTPHGPEFIKIPPGGFGVDALGDTSTETVTVANPSNGVQHIEGVTIAGANTGDFKIIATSCTGTTLAAGQTCTVQVKFAPVANGTRTAEVQVTAKGAEPVTATIQGTVGAGGTSTDSGGTSTDSGATSTDTGATSTDTGGTSTDTGGTSTDTGGTSTDTGGTSTDSGH